MHELKFDRALTGKQCFFYLVARQLVLLHGSGMNWFNLHAYVELMRITKLSMRQLHDALERANVNHPEYLLKTVSGALRSGMNLICSLFALTENLF